MYPALTGTAFPIISVHALPPGALVTVHEPAPTSCHPESAVHLSPVSVLSVLWARHRRVETRVPRCSLTERLHCPKLLRSPPLRPSHRSPGLCRALHCCHSVAFPGVSCSCRHTECSRFRWASSLTKKRVCPRYALVFSRALPAVSAPSAHLRGRVPGQPRARRRLEPHLTNPLWLDSWVARLCLCKQCDSEHP